MEDSSIQSGQQSFANSQQQLQAIDTSKQVAPSDDALYRRKMLYYRFEKAQEAYLERKNSNQALKQEYFSNDQDLSKVETCFPQRPQFGKEMFDCYKKSSYTKKNLQRFCRVVGNKLLQFQSAKDFTASKALELDKDPIQLELQSCANDSENINPSLNQQTSFKKVAKDKSWHKPAMSKRLVLTFPKNKQLYVYSENVHFLVCLSAEIKSVNKPEIRLNSQKIVYQLSTIFNVTRLNQSMTYINTLYTKSTEIQVRQHLLIKNLLTAAHYISNHNKQTLQITYDHFLNEQIRSKMHTQKALFEHSGLEYTKSTFRQGACHPSKIQNSFYTYIPMILNKRIRDLVDFCRQRRSIRNVQQQQELTKLCQLEQSGTLASAVTFSRFNTKGERQQTFLQKGKLRIYLKEKHIFIEDLDPKKLADCHTARESQDSVFEYGFCQVLKLSEISMISTDIDSFYEGDKQDYKITLYGPFLQQTIKELSKENLLVELMHYTPLKACYREWFTLKIKKLSLPLEFLKQFNRQLLLQIRVTQCNNKKIKPQKSFHVDSEYIFLNLSDEYIVANGGSEECEVLLDKEVRFNVRPLLDGQNECIIMAVRYINVPTPLKNVVQDYAYAETAKWDSYQSDTVDFIQYKDKVGSVTLQNSNKEGDATLLYEMKRIKDQPYEKLDFRSGPRLLVGRYCIYEPENSCQHCQVLQVNANGTVKLRVVKTQEEIEKNISISKLKFIERYGVSVYDKKNEPKELQSGKFQWKCDIVTQDKRMLNLIQSAIQYRHVQEANKKRMGGQKGGELKGRFFVSILSLHNLAIGCLEKDKASIQPYCVVKRIDIVEEKQEQTHEFFTETITRNAQQMKDQIITKDLGQLASYIDRRNPCGKLLNLGEVSTEVKTKILISVYNQIGKKLLGQHEFTLSNAQEDSLSLSIEDRANEYTVPLLLRSNDQVKKVGALSYQTRFIPDNVTRNTQNLCTDLSQLQTPESFRHYKAIIETEMFDKYGYKVPLGQYYWPEHQKSNLMDDFENVIRPLQLQGFVEYSNTVASLQQSAKEEKVFKCQPNIFISQEELRDLMLYQLNPMRPCRQPYTHNLINIWWSQKSVSRLPYLTQQAEDKWNQLLDKRQCIQLHDEIQQAKQGYQEQPTLVNGTTDFLYHKYLSQKEVSEYSRQEPLHNSDIGKLIFADVESKEENYISNEIYNLVHCFGLPHSLRSRLWREFFKVQILELDEISSFKQKFNGRYDDNLTVYENYVTVADEHDCLSFLQVDEDISQYQLPQGYLENLSKTERQTAQIKAKAAIREILRVLCLWSKQKKIDNKRVSIAYSNGLLDVIQRMLTVTENREDIFWILVGVIHRFPKPFTVSESVLSGDCFSIMRDEIQTFKSLVQQYLPKVFYKFKNFGLPFELVFNDCLLSLYSRYFSSEIVLRLWDLIFYSLSHREKEFRKQGLWYQMAPLYLILKKKERQILQALSCEDIIKVFESGSTLWYDPIIFTQELDEACQVLFIENLPDQSRSQSRMQEILFGQQLQANQKAIQFEDTQFSYKEKVIKMFKQTKEENRNILDLVTANEEAEPITKMILDQNLLIRFKQYCNNNGIQDTETMDVDADLGLKEVSLFLHSIIDANGSLQLNQYRLKLTYLRCDPTSFALYPVEKTPIFRFTWQNGALLPTTSQQEYHSLDLRTYVNFQYRAGANYLKIELFSVDDPARRSGCVISLFDYPKERFARSRVILRNPAQLLDPMQSGEVFDQIKVSFFLQSEQRAEQPKPQIASFNRKLPVVSDLFNEHLVDMQQQFKELIEKESEILKQFLSAQQATTLMNEQYSYCKLIQGEENISQTQFVQFACEILPVHLRSQAKLTQIYKAFTTGVQITNLNEPDSLLAPFVQFLTQENQNAPQIFTQSKAKSFSLRQFLTSLVLVSQCTVDEKISLLYDMFDMADGSQDMMQTWQVYQLIYTVFERSQYYMPLPEIMNSVEFVFNSQVSLVQKAYWTRDPQSIQSSNQSMEVKLDMMLFMRDIDLENECTSIDVSHEVQMSFLNYYSVFGTKIVDFSSDVSPFNFLQALIGTKAQTMLSKIKHQNSQYVYKLVLFCQNQGERFIHTVNYCNTTGKLLHNLVPGSQKPDITSMLMRNQNRIYLNGVSRPISKTEFLKKIDRIPMFTNLLRSETLYQDWSLKYLQTQKLLQKRVIVMLVSSEVQFQFDFQKDKSNSTFLEGSRFQETQTPQYNFIVQFKHLTRENVVFEIRERILQATRVMFGKIESRRESNTKHTSQLSKEQIENDIKNLTFYALHENEWFKTGDFDRLLDLRPFNKHQLILKLSEDTRQDHTSHVYDCLSFYKHGDETWDWRPCRIVRREIKEEPIGENQHFTHQIWKEMSFSNYIYWIEFAHFRNDGHHMWSRRTAQDIIFSTQYTRNYQQRFQTDAISYLKKMYNTN